MTHRIFTGLLIVTVMTGTTATLMVDLAIAQQLTLTVDVPRGDLELGLVSIPRTVTANGQALSSGDYQVRLTARSATPDTVGALTVLERWVEFRQDDDVKGREVVTIVPNTEISDVAKSASPGSGSSRVELLKENEYMRVWINQDGTHYLIHLVVG
jgi:hypothetical protein|tara:strand:- start:384 stop:851 length:468 start_codon:yes stop_codon:yes gene_type:complete